MEALTLILLKFAFFHENQTDGIVLIGTTGESATLTAQERKEILNLRYLKQKYL